MTLERFIEQIQFINDGLSEVDEVMEEASLDSTEYYPFVREKMAGAISSLHKANHYFTLIPNDVKNRMKNSLASSAARIKKTSRGLFLFTLRTNDNVLGFLPSEGQEGEGQFISMVSGDELIESYNLLCDSLDICMRLINCNDTELVKAGRNKIMPCMDLIEELFELINVMQFDDVQLSFLNDSLIGFLKVVERLDVISGRRLGIYEEDS